MKILYYSGWLATRIISKLIFRIKVSGTEHFPKGGGFILATNHISNFDPLLAGSWAPRQVYFFAKQELFKNKFFGWLITQTNALPVRRGAVDRAALKMSQEVIKRGFGLTIFPEGTRSKKDGFLDPKPGVGLMAMAAKCPIVPGYIHGSNGLKDCFLGRSRMAIRYGEPIPASWLESLPGDKSAYFLVAEEIMNRISRLKAEVMASHSA